MSSEPVHVPFLLLAENIVMVICYTSILLNYFPILFELFKRRRHGRIFASMTPSFVIYIGSWFLTAFFGFTGNTYLAIKWRPVSITRVVGVFWTGIPEKCLSHGTVLVAFFVNIDRILILCTKQTWRKKHLTAFVTIMIVSLLTCWFGFGIFYYFNFVDQSISECRVFGCTVTVWAERLETYFKLSVGTVYIASSVAVLFILKRYNTAHALISSSKNRVGECLTLFTVACELVFDLLPYLILWIDLRLGSGVVNANVGTYPRLSVAVNGALCAWIYHHKLLPTLRTQNKTPANSSYESNPVKKLSSAKAKKMTSVA